MKVLGLNVQGLLRPRLIGLVVVMLCLLGIAAYLTMARQEDPSFPYRAGLVTVIYPGATAEAVERLVLEPLSDELSQVEELEYFTATARTGVVLINLSLDDAIYATDSAWDRVRQALARAELEFPDGVAQISLDDRLIDIPAVVLAVRGDASLVQLGLEAERLKRALADLPGLSRIELEGKADEQVTIALRDAQMSRLGISPAYLAGILAQRNQVIPGGFIVSGDQRMGLLPNSEFVSIDALRATQIPLPEGGEIPLEALAEIWRGPLEPAQPKAWFDGEQAVIVSLTAVRGQLDAIRFGEQVRERLALLRADFAPLQIDEMFFQPDQVKERLDGLEWSLLGSVLIIVLVVFAGMGWRMGILVAVMLPLVALISLGIYDLGGGILHQIAVIGLVISLGILIDNAIVMVENVQDRLNRGESRAEAVRQAIGELAGPLGASTATTLAAFTPLLLAKGGTADFTRGIPVMIMLTLTVSYLLAIGVAPLLAGRFLKPTVSRSSRVMENIGNGLARLSSGSPVWMIVLGAVMVCISLALLPQVKLQFFPNADRPLVVVELYMPEGTDQQRTEEVAAELESRIRQRPQVLQVHRFAGSAGPSFYYNLLRAPQAPNRARIVIHTEDLAATSGLIHWVREHVASSMPELDVVASTLGQGPPRAAPVEVRLYHPNDNLRIAAAEQVFALLKASQGAVDVRHDIDLGVPVLRVDVDDALAARHGLTRAEVAQALNTRSLGLTVEQYRQERDPLPLVLRSPEGTRQSLERLMSASVFNDDGEAIPLTALARIAPGWQPAAIRQRNGVRVYSVTAGLEEGYSFSQVLDQLNRGLAETPLPAGVRLELGGDSEGSGDANSAIFTTAPVGILLLLFFLLLQFNSFRRVGIILLTVPLASVGVFPGLVLSGSPFGFQSVLGIIALVGIVVNNAIVLLDLVDQRLAAGAEIKAAVAEAVARRTRPILLTTATTIAGLLPLAFSASTLWPPMAWAIISGLLASTVLTLLVIPAVCRLALKTPAPPRPVSADAAQMPEGQ
ncbi:MAG: efflux RND transporter permease subunit [Halopseudomonas sp.]